MRVKQIEKNWKIFLMKDLKILFLLKTDPSM